MTTNPVYTEPPRLLSQPSNHTWVLEVEEQTYNVQASIKIMGGINIKVNGNKQIVTPLTTSVNAVVGLPSDYGFRVGKNHQCVVRTHPIFFTRANNYELIVDNYSLKTHKLASPIIPMPIWGWVFMTATGMIAILTGRSLTIQGFLPIFVAVGASYGCIKVAASNQPLWQRLALCSIITVVAWVAVLTLIRLLI